MNDHNNTSGSTSPDVPPPLPSNRPGVGTSTPPRTTQPSAQSQSVTARPDEPLPAGIKGWCWGGFLLNWVWAIRFRVWWGLLAFVPLVGLAVPIWLGIKGREVAWRRGEWSSVQAFNDAQRKWSIGGAVVTVLACLVYGGSLAYERWQAHQAETASPGPGMTPEQMARVISEPVDLKQLGVRPSASPSAAASPMVEPYSVLPEASTMAVPMVGRSGPFNIYAVEPKDDLEALKYFVGNTVYQPHELAPLLPVIEKAAADHYGLTCEYLCADAQGNIVGRTRIHTDRGGAK